MPLARHRVLAVFALLTFPAHAEFQSGQYEALALAFGGDRVSGVFSASRDGNGTADAPQFSCIFFLQGQLVNGRAEIETWFPGDPERIPGTLSVAGDGAAFQLAIAHGGCQMTVGDMVDEPFRQSLTQPSEGWIGVGLVATEKARLHPAPSVANVQTPYLVEFDTVAVLEQRPDWIRVRCFACENPVTGWLQAFDMATTLAHDQRSTSP